MGSPSSSHSSAWWASCRACGEKTLELLDANIGGRRPAALHVYEAADGTEAIQIGLQQSPQIALLDGNMPRLGGIEVALVLRESLPGLRLALHTGDPSAHSEG